jgi:hypothetical protein
VSEAWTSGFDPQRVVGKLIDLVRRSIGNTPVAR